MNFLPEMDEDGQLQLPPRAQQKLGKGANGRVDMQFHEQGITFKPSIHHLRRIYLEVTNRCNLNCRTCMRNVWDKNEGGFLTLSLFRKLLQEAASLAGPIEFFFGGYGEPLLHPHILTMIQETKVEGFHTSLITNGMLLSSEMSDKLIDAGLDMLWVSIDGASPESYADVRLGAELPEVIENLEFLLSARRKAFADARWAGKPRLGISFVASQGNIDELPAVLELGQRLGATRFFVTNLLPHREEQLEDILYRPLLDHVPPDPGRDPRIRLSLPRFPSANLPAATRKVYQDHEIRTDINGADLDRQYPCCPFLERRSTAVRWDGALSPCLPLLHTHPFYLDERKHLSHAHHIGNLSTQTLSDLWQDQTYREFRGALKNFSFSPCTSCNSCNIADNNLEDCLGNDHPACGTCLWAQGLIRCP
ncbi:MAG: radical SAM protein [Anaerolineales bacterium]